MNLKYNVLIEIEAYDDETAEKLRSFYVKEFENGIFYENATIEYPEHSDISSIDSKGVHFRPENLFGLKEAVSARFNTVDYKPFYNKIKSFFKETPTIFIRFTYNNIVDLHVKEGDYFVEQVYFNSKSEEDEIMNSSFFDLSYDEAEETFKEVFDERSYMQIFEGVERLEQLSAN